MAKNEIVNVKISKPRLYIEDHGCLTFDFVINGSGFGCCFGGYKIGGKYGDGSYDASESGLIAIMKIMDVVGVKCWEDLDGKYCRVVDPGLGGCVTKIGNLIDDKWFNIKEFFEEAKNRTEVEYTKMSKERSDADVVQDVYNRMKGRGATKEELDTFRNLIQKYDALEKKEIPIVKKTCETCKYDDGTLNFDDYPCSSCNYNDKWEAKDE